MSAQAGKTILVCGDLVWDFHISRFQGITSGYYQSRQQSQLATSPGGAWYLCDVINQAIAAVEAETKKNESFKGLFSTTSVMAPKAISLDELDKEPVKKSGIAKAFTIWEWFEGEEQNAKLVIDEAGVKMTDWKPQEPMPGAWRIKEFVGCKKEDWEKEAEVSANFPRVENEPSDPDFVVIDDLGLGFSDFEKVWPACLSGTKPPKDVVIKAPPGSFEKPLWGKLLSKDWASHVTVVIKIEALCEMGANLSRGLSWDKTLEEVKAVFQPGGACWPLRWCKRVVVVIGFSGAAVFSRLPRSPVEKKNPPKTLQFERLIFDPRHLEDRWPEKQQGSIFGISSIVAAAMVAHGLFNPEPSTHLTVSWALNAAREQYRIGAGHSNKKFDVKAASGKILAWNTPGPFKTAYPRELLDPPVLSKETIDINKLTILNDMVGVWDAFLGLKACEIVRKGKDKALESVPRLQFGKYFTVDREEIERLSMLRNLILQYRRNPKDIKPLSIAVFGTPGSGKSFAIKQLAESLFGKEQSVLEYNLSQFKSIDDLHEAFHVVRDKSVQGQLPFVFWDEFDSNRGSDVMGWLKEFLAPMQDAHFVSNGTPHPFGKCVFIFAGGTCEKFDEFAKLAARAKQPPEGQENPKDNSKEDQYKNAKCPDFLSRLRGYVDIKGPNPTSKDDAVHVIRRALLLREFVERYHAGAIDPATKTLQIDSAVLEAFLRVGKGEKGYHHGARSLEAIVSLCRLSGPRLFGPSDLPAKEVMISHVSGDFMDIVNDRTRYYLSDSDIDMIAEMKHNAWKKEKEAQGYVRGDKRCDTPPNLTHPLLVSFNELKDEAREGNRHPARLTIARLETQKYRVEIDASGSKGLKLPGKIPQIFSQAEHRRWMREKMGLGVAYNKSSCDALLLHSDICSYNDIPVKERNLDTAIIGMIREFLKKKGLKLTKPKKVKPKSKLKPKTRGKSKPASPKK